MNTLYELEKLRNNVSYLEWLFELSTEANARQRLQRYKEAKQELKEFKAKYYPHLLQQPKFNLPKMSYTPMSVWTEKFEEYGDY